MSLADCICTCSSKDWINIEVHPQFRDTSGTAENRNAVYILQAVEHRFNPVCFVFLGGDDECEESAQAVRLACKRVDDDHLTFKDLENPGEQPTLFRCHYLKFPDHVGLFLQNCWEQ
jgi:hypothetical protein